MTYNNQPTSRPLPATLPEYILVEVYASEYRGREQWVAQYRLAHNGKSSDFLKVVVNFRRHQGQHAGLWWVKPITMASQQWLVFATPECRAGAHVAPLTVRMGQRLVLQWDEDEYRLVARREGWTFRFASAMREPRFVDGEYESWQVQIEHIDLLRGNIIVSPLAPDPQAAAELPQRVSYVGLYSLRDGNLIVEGDVFRSVVAAKGIEVLVDSPDGRFQVKIEEMRRHNNRLIGWVSVWGNRDYHWILSHFDLAEIVPIEGPVATHLASMEELPDSQVVS